MVTSERKRLDFLADKLNRYRGFLRTTEGGAYTLYHIDHKAWYTRAQVEAWVEKHEPEHTTLVVEVARSVARFHTTQRLNAAKALIQRLTRFRAWQNTDAMRRKYDRDLRRARRRLRFYKRQVRGAYGR